MQETEHEVRFKRWFVFKCSVASLTFLFLWFVLCSSCRTWKELCCNHCAMWPKWLILDLELSVNLMNEWVIFTMWENMQISHGKNLRPDDQTCHLLITKWRCQSLQNLSSTSLLRVCCRHRTGTASNTFGSSVLLPLAVYMRRWFGFGCHLWSLYLLPSVGTGKTETVLVPMCWPETIIRLLWVQWAQKLNKHASTIHTRVHTCRPVRMISRPELLVVPGFLLLLPGATLLGEIKVKPN